MDTFVKWITVAKQRLPKFSRKTNSTVVLVVCLLFQLILTLATGCGCFFFCYLFVIPNDINHSYWWGVFHVFSCVLNKDNFAAVC